MDIRDYQKQAQETSGAYGNGIDPQRQAMALLALTGELGELCNLYKKRINHGHEISDLKFADELGDVLWYVAEAATSFGFDLEVIARMNIEKLKDRYPEGFSQEASIHRDEDSH